MTYRLALILSGLALTGCASEQLNYNTVDVATSVNNIYERQTLNNLSKFIDNKNAIPSQMQLAGGTVQTTMTVSPSASLPLSAQVARSATGAIGAVQTLTNSSSIAGGGLTLGASNTGQQNYNVAPNIDAISLRNQQALYRYAVWGGDLRSDYHPPRVFIADQFYLDPFPLQEPHCVICADRQGVFKRQRKVPVHVNSRLKPSWLRFDDPQPGYVPLGHFGNHDLYIEKKDYDAGVFTDLVLFTMPYTEPSETFAGTEASNKDKERVKLTNFIKEGDIVIKDAKGHLFKNDQVDIKDKKTGELLKNPDLTFTPDKVVVYPSAPAPSSIPSAPPATNYRIAPFSPFGAAPQGILPLPNQ